MTIITIIATVLLLLSIAGVMDDNKVVNKVSTISLVLSLLTIFVNPILGWIGLF